MSLTVQTNIASMIAQQNLSVNSDFMTQTITRLTSGYRINSSADDAAGLSIANQYRSNITELTQGVRNGNDGVSALQIVDGGLNNISTILDRLKTLATQSGSGTFTGDRTTLNNEYQGLLNEITRQASNIGLNAGGQYNTVLEVFIGGTTNLTNAQVSVNLSGSANAVDSASLGLGTTSVLGGGTGFTNNTVNNLNNPNALFDVGAGGANNETFTVTYINAQGQVTTSSPLTITSTAGGISGTALVSSLNTQLQNAGVTGVSAQIGSDGTLQFTGGNLLSVAHAINGTVSSTAVSAGATSPLINAANYNATGQFANFVAGSGAGAGDTTEAFQVTVGGRNYTINLTSNAAGGNQLADTQAHAISSINSQLQGSGVYAVANGTSITLQSSSAFTIAETAFTQGPGGTTLGTGGFFYGNNGSAFGTSGAQTVTAANNNASATGNAQLAISAIDAAIKQLGLVQGRVGAGENSLQYAMNLANSQISSYSAAQSRIRDADMAAEAANLTKAQILEQSSIAAMAQANSAPQAVLALLK